MTCRTTPSVQSIHGAHSLAFRTYKGLKLTGPCEDTVAHHFDLSASDPASHNHSKAAEINGSNSYTFS
jgi:hypothetical protein